METAKIFPNGGSQAVRLSKTCRFNTNEVLVNHIGDVVMLILKDSHWNNLLTSLDLFTDDFLSEKIETLPPEEREQIL